MQVIFTCLVIVMFITGTVFGFAIGKNGFVQIGGRTMEKSEKTTKKTVEQQLDDMMNYDGKVRKEGR